MNENIDFLDSQHENINLDCPGIVYENIKELANRTKLPVSWWYGQTRKTGPGTVPRIKKGKYILFVPKEVDLWLKSQVN